MPPATIGPYQIERELGRGGMGEVYLARDSRLDRQVAIKTLPAVLAQHADQLARLRREARILASLNHPGIGAIHGLEVAEGHPYLVLEFIAGETLAKRLAGGAIPIDEALAIARQIAEALEAAHERGVIHRDLKPGNVMVTPEGVVKVLDFGLARTADRPPPSSERLADRESPTMSLRSPTIPGAIMGTAGYMSPEQARGKSIDKRTDIWAFGVVVYEMLTGRRAFAGEGIAEVLAAVLREDVDWRALPDSTPPRLRRLLERCLDRDPRERLRDIGEARVEIGRIEAGAPEASGGTHVAAPAVRRRREVAAWTLAGVATIAAVLAVVARTPLETAAARLVRLPFLPPDGVVIDELSSTVISPDGQKVLFSGRGPDGRRVLWVRALEAAEAKPLPDTDDAIEAFWSPDSSAVAFGAQGKLKRVNLAGGRAEVLTDAARLVGGAWSPSGAIVFGPDYRQPLVRIGANGRERAPATRLSPEMTGGDRYPVFLPDGRHFIYWSSNLMAGQAIMLGSLDSTESRMLLPDFAPAVYLAPGWLVYARNGVIVAHAFDASRNELTGEPRPVGPAPEATWDLGGRFSASNDGMLLLQDPKGHDYQLTWFDRQGSPAGTLGPMMRTLHAQVPRISPDGHRVVVQRLDPATRNQDLWIGDVARGTFDRFTTDQAMEQMGFWSGDGSAVICAATRDNVRGIYRLPVTGGAGDLLIDGTRFPRDVSREGSWLLYAQRTQPTRTDLFVLPLTHGGTVAGDRTPRAVAASAFDESSGAVAPDGRWIAYTSDVTNALEVYVRRLMPDGTVGEPTRVSPNGGIQPLWSRDGRELFFLSTPQGLTSAQLMATPVKLGDSTFEFTAPEPLFTVSMLPRQEFAPDYDVSSDGRFLVGTVVGGPPITPITVVFNAMAGVAR